MKIITLFFAVCLLFTQKINAQKPTYLYIGENAPAITDKTDGTQHKPNNKNYYCAIPLFKFENNKWQLFENKIPKQKLYFLKLTNDFSSFDYEIDSFYSKNKVIPNAFRKNTFYINKSEYPIMGIDYSLYYRIDEYDYAEPLLISNTKPKKCYFYYKKINENYIGCTDYLYLDSAIIKIVNPKIENYILKTVKENNLGNINFSSLNQVFEENYQSALQINDSTFLVSFSINMNFDAVRLNVPFNKYSESKNYGNLYSQMCLRNRCRNIICLIENNDIIFLGQGLKLHTIGDFNNDGKLEYFFRNVEEILGSNYLLIYNNFKESLSIHFGGN